MSEGMHFDVFVVGAMDPSPVAQMHLAARLAEKFQAPAAQVAQAIASRNLRAGQNLDDAQARALADQLGKLGAQTEFRPSLGKGRGGRTTGVSMAPVATTMGSGTPVTNPPTMAGGPPGLGSLNLGTPGTMAGGPPTMGGGMPGTMAGGPPTMGMGMGTPLGGPPTMGMPGTMAGGPPTMGSDIVGRDPFAGSSMGGPTLTLAAPSPTMARGGPMTMGGATAIGGGPTTLTPLGKPSRGGDAFGAGPEPGLPKLELGRAPQSSSDEMPAAKRRREANASMGGTADNLGTESGGSGLESVKDPKAHMSRCAEHGLYFDKRTSSGCRKCMEPAAAKAQNLAKKLDRQSLGFKLMMLREDPVRRGFYGLALALLLGIIPAAVHAMKVGAPEVAALRTEQAKLSREIGTEENLEKWRVLDTAAHNTHGKNMQTTALIWVVVGGVALGGWYRFT